MSLQLTPRESEFLSAAFQCMDGKPNIDYTKFAGITGLKNAKSARDSFAPLLKKLMGNGIKATKKKGSDDVNEQTGSGDESPTTPKASAKAGRKRKSAATPDEGTAPKSRKRTVKAEKTEDAAEVAADDEDKDDEW